MADEDEAHGDGAHGEGAHVDGADVEESRVVITNADIAAAKRDWQLARGRGDLPDRVDAAYDLYRRLISAQAQQIADTYRRTGVLRSDQG